MQIDGAVDCANTDLYTNILICVECIALYSYPMTAALGHVKNQIALYNEYIYIYIYIYKKTTGQQCK